jgi:hypothetical protein
LAPAAYLALTNPLIVPKIESSRLDGNAPLPMRDLSRASNSLRLACFVWSIPWQFFMLLS